MYKYYKVKLKKGKTTRTFAYASKAKHPVRVAKATATRKGLTIISMKRVTKKTFTGKNRHKLNKSKSGISRSGKTATALLYR